MKNDIQKIIEHLNCDGEVFRLRNWLLSLNASQPNTLKRVVEELNDTIKQTNVQSHEHIGYYYLFLGCVYYEQDNYQRAIIALQSAINEMWGEKTNKSLARWLLGLSYSNAQEFPKARRELQAALQMLATNARVNSPRQDKDNQSRQTIRQDIKNTLEELFNQPLFRSVQPDPVQRADRFRLQDPPPSEKDALPISLEIPISVTNENYPVNKLSFKFPSSESKPQPEHKSTERIHENRTDDEGYLVIQSIPVFDGYARAGQSDAPELNISADNFAEFHQVHIDGELHILHSLRSKSKQVNINKENTWGWIKVKGKSMNAIKGNLSINDGDYILFQSDLNADDNDIVIAVQRSDFSTHIKRLRKSEKMLYSETSEKGPEYEPIDIKENNMGIVGIVYAVAKPTTS